MLSFVSGLIGISSIVACYNYKQSKKLNHELIITNDQLYIYDILEYIYLQYSDKIKNIIYGEKFQPCYDFHYQSKNKYDVIYVYDCDFIINYQLNNKNYPLRIKVEIVKDNNQARTISKINKGRLEETIFYKITLSGINNEYLFNFVKKAREYINNKDKQYIRNNIDNSINIYYYRKDYWSLLSKIPKRIMDTIYLKEGVKEDLLNRIDNFLSIETKNNYIEYGIPYKNIYLIYGPPGTGKTTMIKGISSYLNCDLYIIPIMKNMLDSDFVDAFSSIEDKHKQKVIVIEDIDTLFEERKTGDKENGLTMQGFLNCLDGFTCMEGTLLFLTANKPEVLDYAMIRSCRIDHKLKLDYADKYQTQQMFYSFQLDKNNNFEDFYKEIEHKQYTTAMLQEFLFYNRNSNNILDKIDQFTEIILNNDPKKYEILNSTQRNFYM